MRKISAVGMGVNLLLVNMAWAADLPSRKEDPGCNCRLHVERPMVAVNDGAGWTPAGGHAALNGVPEGKMVASNDAGLTKTSYGSGWHAHFDPAQQPLRAGDLVNVKPGGLAHLSWPDGTSMDLPEGVTRIDQTLCKSATAPVAAVFPPAAVALAGLAVAGGIAGAVVASQPNNPPPPFLPPPPPSQPISR